MINTRVGSAWALAIATAGLASPASAHFQELIPSTDILVAGAGKSVVLDMVFTHPFEGGPVMPMGTPARFGVAIDGKRQDLSSRLTLRPVDGRATYRASYTVTAPGGYVFFLEPAPYWEPAERKMIIHYTKVVVDAFGAGNGWDAAVGFPVEIEPLVRPYGLWSGNVFRGIVRRDGVPVPFAEIEVEWRNDGSVKAPADPFVTQVIKADAAGTFAYAMPRGGWWGFAALLEGPEPMKSPTGEMVPVEQGGLIWVKTVDMR